MKNIRTKAALAALCALPLLTAGCSGSSGSTPGGTTGQVSVAITDAASNDIALFEVDVTGIQLRRATGTTVAVLAAPLRIDLASLTDTSNLLSSAAVPAGSYTGATVTLDMTNARCVLVGKTTPATILDASGSAVTGTITVPLQLGTPFSVVSTAHRLLELDFDLDQSFVTDPTGNTVSLEPAFVLRIDPSSPREIVTVGTLTSVDTATSRFVGTVRSLAGGALSDVTFQTSGATVFQIDGVPSTGAAGLTALALLPVDTSIQCYGSVAATGRINAIYVEAGAGTYNGGNDIVEGHIVGRTGGIGSDAVLEVLGHSNNAAHTTFQYATSFLVTTSFANTKVVRRGWSSAFDVDELNVGQRVRVFGSLSGTTMTANTATSVIRQQPTRIFGQAAGAPAGTILTLDLARVGLLPETAFDWADGGFTPVDPNAFEANVGALAVGQGINSTSTISAVGYFSGIADAGPDFTAVSLSNHSNSAALLFVRNRLSAGFNVLTTANAVQIQLNVVGVAAPGEVAIVDRGFAGSIPLPTAPTPTINHPTVNGFYSLRDRTAQTVRIFTRFSDFASALSSDIAQGATLVQIGAIGTYTQVINTIDAPIASAVVD